MKLTEVHKGDLMRLVHFENGTEIVCKVVTPMDDYGNVTVRKSLRNGTSCCAEPELVNDHDHVIVEYVRARKNEVHKVQRKNPSRRSM